MQAVDQQVLGQVLNWLNSGEACWLATVVQTWGSSPRPVGSLLTCNRAGVVVGSLSGGCVEEDLLEKLIQGELAAKSPQFFKYGQTAEDSEKFGLPCGGQLDIVVEPLHPSAHYKSQFELLNRALTERRCAQRSVRLSDNRSSAIEVSAHAPLLWDAANQQLVHTYGPRYHLFVIGAGMVSQYLSEMAQMLDYDVTVCDPRSEFIEAFAVPGVHTINDMPDDAIRAHASDPASAIVALTHDPRIDDMGLMEALTTEAFYVGAMGSTRTSANRRARLLALDIKESEVEKLHAPIGLAIGSKTPPEIAIAILAEITAVRKSCIPEVAQVAATAH